MNLGDKIYNLRKKHGLSQEELANKLNVTRQTVSKWELSQSVPDTNSLLEMSKLFDVSLDELTSSESKPTSKKSEEYIDLQEQKPRRWLFIILIIVALAIVVLLVDKYINYRKNKAETNPIKEIFDNATNTIKNNSISNSRYELYIGTEYGSSVSSLLDLVIKNNKTNKEHLLTVKYKDIETTDPEEIKNLKKNFDVFTKYETSLDYDENNLAKVVTIEDLTDDETSNKGATNNNYVDNSNGTNYIEEAKEEQKRQTDEMNKKVFNSSYEFYSGSQNGFFLKGLCDKTITNNNKGERLVTISYNGINYSSESDINNFRTKLSDWTDYNVSLSYDNDGYVYLVSIN